MLKYILELKNRFILLFITWLSVILVGYYYKETLLFLFLESEMFSNNEFKIYYFIFTDIIEVFSVYIDLILFFSAQVLILYVLYHSFTFLSRGLFNLEYLSLKFVIKTFLTIWFISIFLSKWILIPMMWEFFYTFQSISFVNLHFEAKLSEYLNFYINFYYIFVFYCQIFTILIFCSNYFNISTSFIRKFRKLHYYIFVLMSTLVSPPEILSQLIISFTVIFCYEIFILKFFINKLIRKPIKAD